MLFEACLAATNFNLLPEFLFVIASLLTSRCDQVESLTRKAQFQEVELERTAKQLKEALAIASEETTRCKAAKEVIKSLTAQVKFQSSKKIKT